MYLVDTSVWVHALRPAGHAGVRALLKPLIVSGETAVTDWILLELTTGLLASERKESLLQWFAPIPRLPFEERWWDVALDHTARLRKGGVSPAAADILIATTAIKHRVTLLHCDADFEAMKPALPLQTLDWTPHLRQ
jgi:predicted nucleic acid-binding protein